VICAFRVSLPLDSTHPYFEVVWEANVKRVTNQRCTTLGINIVDVTRQVAHPISEKLRCHGRIRCTKQMFNKLGIVYARIVSCNLRRVCAHQLKL